jgi:pimeloyl-ACP methyl ester carboxylesterase
MSQGRVRRWMVLSVSFFALFLAAPAAPAATEAAATAPGAKAPTVPGVPPLTPKVQVTLTPCRGLGDKWCGRVDLPLDHTQPNGTTIEIGFLLYRHSDNSQPPLEPIVAQEGGPGYATSYSRGYYLGLFKPLMDRRDLLMIDARGTGYSSAVDCPWLQSLHFSEYDQWVDAVGACGRRLGDASDLYQTAYSTDDMADIIHALGYDSVDLYGDSYGTFFSQTFAVRHPGMLRSLVLDAAYPVEGADMWQRDWASSQALGYQLVCQRDPGCSGDPMARLSDLLDQLRIQPIVGRAGNDDGVFRNVVIDPGAMAYIYTSAGYSFTNYRDFDAAVQAALNGDNVPLLRLARESIYLGGGGPIKAYSQGLADAVGCNDYPQAYDMFDPPAARANQYQQAITDLENSDPGAFAPFTVQEWITSPIEDYDSCLKWPVPNHYVPPMPPGHAWPAVPTLVMVGDLDSVTSAQGSQVVASQFPNSTYVEVPNMTHVTALGDRGRCASQIVLRFVETLAAGDTSCVNNYPAVRAVDAFALHAADIPAGSSEERAAVVAADTVGDVMTRWINMYGNRGPGLRGGSFSYAGWSGHTRWTLDKVQWVEDVKVSGSAKLNRRNGNASADLVLSGAGVPNADLHLVWNDIVPNAQATVTGTVGGTPVNLVITAP